jgi:hypothetical protein
VHININKDWLVHAWLYSIHVYNYDIKFSCENFFLTVMR